MSKFNPGDGWREVRLPIDETGRRSLIEYDGDDQPVRGWVREEPVPSLPTGNHTVIVVQPKMGGMSELWVRIAGIWFQAIGSQYMSDEGMQQHMAGYWLAAKPVTS